MKSTLYPGAERINFEPGLDWQAGELLALTGTNVNPEAAETLEIKSYDPATGVVELVEPIEHYHYGALSSTARDFGGLDMRSDLLLLSRDITIEADTTINRSLNEPWGCRILVTDFYELQGGYQKA